jgi:TnpA family transposase
MSQIPTSPCSVASSPAESKEAIYIFDGLLENRSEIRPDTLHADTQGQSETVFGLAYLLAIQLMPRIRNWKHLTLYALTTGQLITLGLHI